MEFQINYNIAIKRAMWEIDNDQSTEVWGPNINMIDFELVTGR
jgi:hypothetical protein